MNARTLITTPIYYVNGSPHVGHAYTTIACDALARFHRLCGRPALFSTGTDEHGLKVERSAEKHGLSPLAFADAVSAEFRSLAGRVGAEPDTFIRTTEPRHRAVVEALWSRLVERDQIYRGVYAGWYAIKDEAFYTDAEIAQGPDGPRAIATGAEVEWVEEPSWFFRLSQWREPLLRLYRERPDFVRPRGRLNEVIAQVEAGLTDLSVSRANVRWGIPVPGDPEQTVYVWIDALANYITVAGGIDAWSGRDAQHVVGKDILRFHAVYWPALLLAAGLEPPAAVHAHGWWTAGGAKIGKSAGNAVGIDRLLDRFGVDRVRYFLLREVPFGEDGEFSPESIASRCDAELANDFGNLVNRALTLVHRHLNGIVPPANEGLAGAALLKDTAVAADEAWTAYDALAFRTALGSLAMASSRINRFFTAAEPWKLKDDPEALSAVLGVVLEACAIVAVHLQPVIPEGAARVLDLLSVPAANRTLSSSGGRITTPGAPLPPPLPPFPRVLPHAT